VKSIAEPFVFVFIASSVFSEPRDFFPERKVFSVSHAVQMLFYFAYYLVAAVEFAMIVRAILSFVMPESDGALIRFLYAVTEPFVAVMRRLFDAFEYENNFFLDIPYFATYFLLMLIKAVLRPFL